MKINDNVKIDEFLISKNSLTGADIRGICTEAALFALKHHRILVEHRDFKNAYELVVRRGKKVKSDFLYC